jgi:CheY-like chemotaxis protein
LSTAAEAETALEVIDQVAPDLVLVETTFLDQGGETLVAHLRGARSKGVRAVVAVVPEGAGDVRQLLASSRVDGALRLPLLRAGLRQRLLQLAGRGGRSGGGIEPIEGGTVDEIARSVGETIRRGIADSLRVGRNERIELPNSHEVLAAAWSAVARIRTHLADHARGRVQFDDALYPEGPAALALTDDLPAAPYVGVSDSLRDRRILLADDDPAVLWFFASLLAEAGAIPIEARSGREALEFARRRTPDLMISDILMPEIDGFSLCREFRRELALSHVPVILLSWKEDFLQRMRELDAGATGYLRKEAGSHQILSTVASALRPRAELATLLASGGEVHGRIDTLGVAGVLQCVAAHRPDAHVSFRDAWNAFEVEIRNGSTLSVTRTASDGSFGRGALALRQLLGVEVGRFVAVDADGTLRNAFDEPLDKVLADGVRDLGAVLDAVSDRRLLQVNRVQFDDQVLAPLLSATPTVVADVAARLRAGESTKELILSGAFAPRDLEQHLRELARRGTIVGVLGPEGEDLVEAARRLRAEQPGTLLHGGERIRRSPSLPPTDLDEEDVQWLTAPETLPPVALAASALLWVTPSSVDHALDAAKDGAFDGASNTEDAISQADTVLETVSLPTVPDTISESTERAEVQRDGTEAPVAEAPVKPLVPPTADPPAQGGKGIAFLFSLAALIALGFVIARLLAPHPIGGSAGTAHGGGADTGLQDAREGTGVFSSDPQKLGFGRVLPFIDRSRGVQVADGNGLLVVEHDARTQAPRVFIDRRAIGQAPIAIALPAGQHELSIEDADRRKRSRLVDIRSGETRILGIVD